MAETSSPHRLSPRRRRTSARFRKMMAIATACSLALTACYPIQTTKVSAVQKDVFGVSLDGKTLKNGGTLVMGLSAEPDKLDPTTSTALYASYVFDSICEKLYASDSAGKPVPQLATGMPVLSDGGKTLTFSVRKDAKFADGTPLNAEAVKISLDRDLTMKTSVRKPELGPLTEVDVTGPYQVTLKLSAPYAPLLSALTGDAGIVMSPKQLKALGDDFGTHPVCVGPMKFVKRIPQTSIELVKDPEYYDAKDIHLDGITYRIMDDANIRAANLRSGDVQVADAISTQDVDALGKEKDIHMLTAASRQYERFTINLGNVDGVGKPPKKIDTPLVQDVRVRHALELSIDRNALVNSVFNNLYQPVCTPFPNQGVYDAAHPMKCSSYDPTKSLRLLKQAGVKTPYEISVKTSNEPDSLRFAAALQASVKSGGFDLSIVPVEFSTLLSDQQAGNYQTLLLGWSGVADPDRNVRPFVKSLGSNNAGYSNPKVDQLLAAGAAETDQARRAAIYRQMDTVLQQDLPLIILYSSRKLTATRSDVDGVYAYADGVIHLAHAAFVAS